MKSARPAGYLKLGFDGGTGCVQDLGVLTRELRLARAAQRSAALRALSR